MTVVVPEFFPDDGLWCLGDLSAPTIKELLTKLPRGTVVEGYGVGRAIFVAPVAAPPRPPKPKVSAPAKIVEPRVRSYRRVTPRMERQKPRQWTEEMLDLAEKLTSRKPASRAAAEMGLTRNSVIGALHRHRRQVRK